MSNIDYEELIRSPLDDLDTGSEPGWAASAAGVVIGLLIGLLLAVVFRGDDSAATTTVAAPTSTITTVAAEVAAPAYPAGYTELAPGLGANVSELIVTDDTVAMAVGTVVARDGDVLAPIWPIGGTWWLETVSGTTVESSRVVLGRYSPGIFSVEFPAEPFRGETAFAAATIVERWDQREMSGSATLPFAGEPFVAPEPIAITISQDVTVIVPVLELGRFLGKVEWDLEGPDGGGRVIISAVLFDAEGTEVGRYDAFPELLEPSDHGVTEIRWQQMTGDDQESATTVVLECSVSVVEVTPATVSFDLGGVPVGR